ncbi:MAG TPA: nuclear transport factor 2 family protein [Thermoanaerobaculia bacterium]|nr:nuclear transport factor 2 family protein [Thermoanaerobaculia bacterium]
MKLLKACLPLVAVPLWAACQSGGGGFQPVVIDMSAPTHTPAAAAAATPAATATPSPRLPSRTPTLPPPPPTPTPEPRIAAVPTLAPLQAQPPMQPLPPQPVEIRAPQPGSPEAVVQSRIDAYNSRDLEKLVSLYAPDVRIFDPPDRLRDSGADQVRQSYARRFASSRRTQIGLAGRMAAGNFVADRETEPGESGEVESSIVISEVLGGKIVRVWILR